MYRSIRRSIVFGLSGPLAGSPPSKRVWLRTFLERFWSSPSALSPLARTEIADGSDFCISSCIALSACGFNSLYRASSRRPPFMCMIPHQSGQPPQSALRLTLYLRTDCLSDLGILT